MNTAELALIGAITSDEKCKARIDKLVEEQGKVELQIERMAAMQGAADATLAEADRKTRAAINIREDAEQRSASLVEFEATLLAMQQALAAEKEKFEEVRAQVDKQQCEASEALNVWEHGLDVRHRLVSEREEAVTAREAEASEKHADLDTKHAALKAAMGL